MRIRKPLFGRFVTVIRCVQWCDGALALVPQAQLPAPGETVALLGWFYRAAPLAPVSAPDYLARFPCELALSREVLLRPQFQLRDAARALDRWGQVPGQGLAVGGWQRPSAD